MQGTRPALNKSGGAGRVWVIKKRVASEWMIKISNIKRVEFIETIRGKTTAFSYDVWVVCNVRPWLRDSWNWRGVNVNRARFMKSYECHLHASGRIIPRICFHLWLRIKTYIHYHSRTLLFIHIWFFSTGKNICLVIIIISLGCFRPRVRIKMCSSWDSSNECWA